MYINIRSQHHMTPLQDNFRWWRQLAGLSNTALFKKPTVRRIQRHCSQKVHKNMFKRVHGLSRDDSQMQLSGHSHATESRAPRTNETNTISCAPRTSKITINPIDLSADQKQQQCHWYYPTDCFIAILSQNQTIPKQTGAKWLAIQDC
jgi:hypothetical protein